MTNSASTEKKQKLLSLVKEINRPKEDIIAYLSTIGIGKVSINTTLEPEIVAKVHNHFRKDIEEQNKHLKKVVDFVQKNRIEIYEAEKKIKEEEEAKRKKEEDLRIKKIIEEENKRREGEKRKQELLAFLERDKTLKEIEEKKKKERQDVIAEKRKKREELQKKEEEKKTAEDKKKGVDSTTTGEAKKEDDKHKKHAEKQKESGKDAEHQGKEKHISGEAKKDLVKADNKKSEKYKISDRQSQTGKAPYAGKPLGAGKPPYAGKPSGAGKPPYAGKPSGAGKPPYAGKPSVTGKPPSTGKPSGAGKPPYAGKPSGAGKPPYAGKPSGAGKPADNRPNRAKFEKITIQDVRLARKQQPSLKEVKKGDELKSKPSAFVKTSAKEGKWYDTKKDKFKGESEYEKKKKTKLVKGHRTKDVAQKEIDEAIRDTYAGIKEDKSTSARTMARKRKKKERLDKEKFDLEIAESQKSIINVTEFLSTSELANIMSIDPMEVIKKCLDLGMMVSINQRLEKQLIELLADEFGYSINFQNEFEEDLLKEDEDPAETLKPRSPVVTVMGHVDHGKTSLLDFLRKANVVAGEAGGITQHIGAYKVKLDNGKSITFLDTPGHEAFTAMRARGGQAADIVVLVVAADDAVMPQTVEAINHALAASVPIVIAINKIDKPNANIEKIKQQLADKNILVEEWGGKYQSAEISAKKGLNIDKLIEKILLEAEILDLKVNPDRLSRGVVLEAVLDKGRGIVATVLVQKGTLKVGDGFLSGIYSGKVKAMYGERDNKLTEALPSTAVQILGFDGLPQAGDTFIVMESEKEIKEIATKRQQLKREQDFRQVKFTTLDDISKQIKEGKQVELNIILKADTDGSAEALADSLHKLTTSEAKVKVIHNAVGQITESDVLLAEASKAIIIGFNVRPNLNARKLAEKNNLDIRLHNIIYNVIDEVKLALEGMLEPEISEEVVATVEIRQVFKVPKIGNVAGCYVLDGKITRSTKVRLLREGLVVFSGTISSLKRIKDDVREVESGYECGIGLENFNDIKSGDIIEGYKVVETKRKLSLIN